MVLSWSFSYSTIEDKSCTQKQIKILNCKSIKQAYGYALYYFVLIYRFTYDQYHVLIINKLMLVVDQRLNKRTEKALGHGML